MAIDLSYVKETIELNSQDIEHSREETNSLLMDDMLQALGYNRRRERGVKPIRSDEADWEVACSDGNRFIVRVYGYRDNLPTIAELESLGILDFVLSKGYQYLVVTNGELMGLINVTKRSLIDVGNIFSDIADDSLIKLSKDGWDESVFIKYEPLHISEEDLVNAIQSPQVITSIKDYLGVDTTDSLVDTQIIGILTSMHSSDSFDISGMKAESDTISRLEAENKKLRQQVEDLQLESSDGFDAIDITDKNEAKVGQLEQDIARLQEENQALKVKIGDLNEQISRREDSGVDLEVSDSYAYREKIGALTSENTHLQSQIKEYQAKIEELEKELSGAEDETVVRARQLLAAIEDNPELPRTYVGVINSRLFQIHELPKFVGTCIQELYSHVSFELMRILFDGDIFKMVYPAKRGDLMINSKSYDIDLEGISEVEILSKLKVVFSKYPKVVFLYKTIGSIDAKSYYKSEDYQSLDDADKLSVLERSRNRLAVSEPDEVLDTSIIPDDSVQLLGLPLSEVNDIIWNEDAVQVISLAILSDATGSMYRVHNHTLEEVVQDGMYALMAFYPSVIDAYNVIHSIDLTAASEWIAVEPVNNVTETGETIVEGLVSIPILDTGYYANIQSHLQAASIIVGVATLIGLDINQVYAYFNAVYDDQGPYADRFIDKVSYDINKTYNYKEAQQIKDGLHVVIKGDMLNSIQVLPGVHQMEEELFLDAIAIRNSSIKGAVDSNLALERLLNQMFDFIGSVEDMNTLVDSLNESMKYFGYNDKVMYKPDDRKPRKVQVFEITRFDQVYSMVDIKGAKKVLMIYLLHAIIFGDDPVEIRIAVDSTKYNAYKNGLPTCSSLEYIGSKVLLEAINNRVKVLPR